VGNGRFARTFAVHHSGVFVMIRFSAPLKVSLLMGVGFFLHAMIPNSNAWPMLWPAVAGVVGVLLTLRSGRRFGFWASIGVGLKTGAIAGAVFLLATAISLRLLSSPSLLPIARHLGAEGPISLSSAVLAGLAVAAIVGVALAGLGAGATYPIAKSRA
jgi:hypothetical protein